jgi:hypothetical protein
MSPPFPIARCKTEKTAVSDGVKSLYEIETRLLRVSDTPLQQLRP